MLGVVVSSSVETYRVAALVGAAENAATFVLASLVSGYKRYLFLTRRSSRHILLGRLRFKVISLLVQHRGAAVLIVKKLQKGKANLIGLVLYSLQYSS